MANYTLEQAGNWFIQIPQPVDVQENWKLFKFQFENYSIAMGLDKKEGDIKLTLQKAIDTCRAHETTNYQLQQMETPHTTEEMVNWTAGKQRQRRRNTECSHKGKASGLPSIFTVAEAINTRRNFAQPMAKATREPTIWENICRLDERPIDGVVRETPGEQWTDQEEQLFQLSTNAKKRWITDMEIGDQVHVVKVQLDTGATCDVMHFKDYSAIIGRELVRALMEILRGLKGFAVIANDILVYGRGYSEEAARVDHDQNLECRLERACLLERAEASNLKFSPENLRLHERQVTYMGHVLSVDSLKADPYKMQAIKDIQPPITVLLSLATLYELLRQLTRQDTIWMWDSAQQQAFVNVKTAVSTTPVLRYYDPQESVELQLDVSQSGLGAVFLHNRQPVNYASRCLTKTERNWSIRLKLQQYAITVKYKKGKELYLADTLIRAPVQEDLNQVHDNLATIIKEGWPGRKSDIPECVQEYWHCRDELSVHDGTIFRGERLVVLQEMRVEILMKAHASHQGLEASVCKVRNMLYWPQMKYGLERKNIVKKCLQTKSDPWLALLELRNIPTSGLRTSPVQLLISMRTRTQMPTSTVLLKPRKYRSHYDGKAQNFPELMTGQEVYIKPAPQAASKLWSPGTITQQLSSHSYECTTKEGTRVGRNTEGLRIANSRVGTPIVDQGLDQDNT
ncbi:hypothetical protein PR048_013533 [Dryococelus australis]|uniref:Reverse transcriptase/retrotransposon-derived protein RNase H-like domain-containing protein n=1 Tax=Dryococelus australis TaxID=614101 RepID=A0ABQ9HTY7_9NEOP|nr:hypothetical protein PR048_013533 [Dryococelus australis]